MSTVGAIVALTLVTSLASVVHGGQVTKQACVDAYHAAQELKLRDSLLEASKRAAFCAQEGCPEVLRGDCTKWTVELGKSTPSIVVTARSPSGDESDVRVFVDGKLIAETLTGSAISMDPGPHQLRFEHSAYDPVEQSIIVAVGIQNRPIEIAFEQAPGSASAVVDDPGLPVAGIVLASVGVAAVGVFAGLAIVGTNEVDELRDSCGRTGSCLEDDVDAAKTTLIVGDIFLATGVVAAGVGTALILSHYLSGDDDEVSAFRWGVAPTADGIATAMSLAF